MEVIQRVNEWIDNNNPSKVLNLTNLNMEALPELPSNLEYLNCSNNFILTITRLPESLKILECKNNPLYNITELVSLSKLKGFVLII
jgi:Leucine-rich repeat (LRR) protein